MTPQRKKGTKTSLEGSHFLLIRLIGGSQKLIGIIGRHNDNFIYTYHINARNTAKHVS